jgi:hypothetical protein
VAARAADPWVIELVEVSEDGGRLRCVHRVPRAALLRLHDDSTPRRPSRQPPRLTCDCPGLCGDRLVKGSPCYETPLRELMHFDHNISRKK